MTSWNGNTFRITGHLCGEFTGPRWIPRTKVSDAELWCFLCTQINGRVNNREAGDLRRYSCSLWRYCNGCKNHDMVLYCHLAASLPPCIHVSPTSPSSVYLMKNISLKNSLNKQLGRSHLNVTQVSGRLWLAPYFFREKIHTKSYYQIDQSHRYGRHQVACPEPEGSYDKTTRTAICFEHKTQYLLIRAPYTRIVVFWHISNIPPMISQSQISCNTSTLYITAIFVRYCYTTGSWLL